MFPRRALSRSFGAALAMVMVTGAALLPHAAAGAPPPYTLEERAAAIASPSLVFIEVKYEGYVYLHATGKRMQDKPTVFYLRCSGVVVNSEGIVLTETDCVRPNDATLRVLAGFSVAGSLVDEKKLTPDKISQYANDLANKSNFAGTDPDSRPVATVHGQLFTAASQAVDSPAVPGEIVYATAAEETNVALIKFTGAKMPAIELAGSAPASGGGAVAVGFATTDADANHATFLPKSQSVQITGTADANGLRMSGDVGPYSRGGAVVDDNGKLAGTIQLDPQSPQGLNRAVEPISSAVDVLSKAGVQNQLGSVDRTYRAALDDYFAGRYAEAIKKFDSVLAEMPTHRLASAYRQQATNRVAIEGDEGMATWLLIVLIAVGVVVLLGAFTTILLLVSRRQRRQAMSASLSPAALALNPFAPTSGYPASSPPMSPLPVSDPYAYGAGPIGGTPLTINPAPQGIPVPFPPPTIPPSGARPDGHPVSPALAPPVQQPPQYPVQQPPQYPVQAAPQYPVQQAPQYPVQQQSQPPVQNAQPPAQAAQQSPVQGAQPPVQKTPDAPHPETQNVPAPQSPVSPASPAVPNPPATPPAPPQQAGPPQTLTAADFAWPEDGDYGDTPGPTPENPWAPPSGQR